jgi:hypothetical protein
MIPDQNTERKRFMSMRLIARESWLVAVALSMMILSGCATVPLENPVESMQDLKGTWQGTVTGPRGSSDDVTMIIKEDGSFETRGWSGFGGGNLHLIAGRVRWFAARSGGTMTLGEENGRQVLDLDGDSGLWGTLTRVE